MSINLQLLVDAFSHILCLCVNSPLRLINYLFYYLRGDGFYYPHDKQAHTNHLSQFQRIGITNRINESVLFEQNIV